MRVLVLGSTGFVGRLVVDELVRAGHRVEAWSRSEPAEPAEHTELTEQTANLHTANLRTRCVDLEREAPLPTPDERWDAAVLAAGPSVPAHFRTDIEGAAAIRIAERALAHIARHAPGARVALVSSAHVLAPAASPIDEHATIDPRGDYGVAKLAVEKLALQHASTLDVVVARLFGSLGPGLPRGLFVSDLGERLARGEMRLDFTGPNALRDLTDGRDVARALRLLVETPQLDHDTFHIGTGALVPLSKIATRIARAMGRNPRLAFTDGSAPTWAADARRLREATGWSPIHDLDASAAWIASELASRVEKGRALAPRDAP